MLFKKSALLLVLICCSISASDSTVWGFFAHRKINHHACFAIPDPLFKFYKANAEYISEHAVDPDKRRHSTKGEAEKHYIDIDHYGTDLEVLIDSFPRNWDKAIEKFGEDTLRAYGIGPYNALSVFYQLRKAFTEKNKERILRFSAELGHYIGDLHVPLHTTENYNGQLSGQDGIHGFWESRLPELFYDSYFMIFEKVDYQNNVKELIWKTVFDSHAHLQAVLGNEKLLSKKYQGTKMTNEERGATVVSTYSQPFSKAYHESLNGMVEERMRSSVEVIASLWYTAWVDAGQPNPDDFQ